jgi:hypothetical protein
MELGPSERGLSQANAKPSRRDEPAQNKAAFAVVLASPNIELGSPNLGHKSPVEPATGHRRRVWPWAWLAVTGVVTLGWLIGIGWAAVELVEWLAR